MKAKLKARASLRTAYIAVASVSTMLAIAAVIVYHAVNPPMAMAAATGDYRSVLSGNWSTVGTWETFNGTSWVPASSAPAQTDGIINIQTGTTVTISANTISNDVIVDAGGTVSITAGRQWTISNGTGTDLQVNGTVTINGILVNNASTAMTISGLVTLKSGGSHTISSGTVAINSGGYYDRQDNSLTTSVGIWTINSGATYAHNVDGNSIIIATWNTGSTCLINGITTTKPGNLNQSFHHFTWNCPSQTAKCALLGKITAVAGDMTWISTGSSYVRLGDNDNFTLNIGGNYYHQGGTLIFDAKSQNCKTNITGNMEVSGGLVCANDSTKDNGEGSPEIYITGDLIITGGTINCSQYLNSGAIKGHMDFYLYGNYNQSSGTVTVTSSGGGVGEFYFDKNGTQNFIKTGGTISQEVNFSVLASSITNLGTSIITGSGTFVLIADGEIQMGDANGITSSGASGNIQVTGTRTFSTSGYYTYNGGSSQVTGNGMPTTVKNLTFNNTSGVALTRNTSVSGTLYMTAGVVTTPSDTLIIGTSTGTRGTLSRSAGMVDGYVKRWFTNATSSNIEFPLGTGGFYTGVNLSYTGAPTSGGTISAHFTATNPGKNGFDIIDAGDTLVNIGYGLWETVTGNGMTGGTFSIDITATALATVADYTKLHMIRRTNSAANWVAQGTHAAGTGSNAIPIVHRTSLTSHTQWGVASGSANPLPVKLLYFNAKQNGTHVDLTWSTASELNSDYFLIERSDDGINFNELIMKRGAGTTTVTKNYADEDLAPLKGTGYYRLSQTDYNGATTIFDIKVVNFKEGSSDAPVNLFSIYPNPFNSGFKISFTAAQESKATLMIVNSAGKVVGEETIQAVQGYNNHEYFLQNELENGIYFAYLVVGETKLTQKIIKQ